MSLFLDEKRLMLMLRALKNTEENQTSLETKIPEPKIDPDSYSSYLPKGFFDEDLSEIQSMSFESVSEELVSEGYDEALLATNLLVLMNENVVLLPRVDRHSSVEIVEGDRSLCINFWRREN